MMRSLAIFAVGCILLAESPDTWDKSQLLPPADLVARLTGKTPPKLLHVGFGVLYRGKHIPGSEYAGPGSKPEGLEALRRAARSAGGRSCDLSQGSGPSASKIHPAANTAKPLFIDSVLPAP